jgi:hypothetical protein
MGVNVVSVPGNVGGSNSTASDLQSALANSLYGEFRRVSWTVGTNIVTGTSVEEGEPFTATASVSGGAGTVSQATTVTNTSPSDWGDANNWSSQTLPVANDLIVVDNLDSDIKWNLDAFAAVNIASVRVLQGFTGNIGLPTENPDGYIEYRVTEMQFQTATTFYEEQASNLGTAARKYNVGSNACTATFLGTGSGSLGSEVTWFSGVHASNALYADGASVLISPLESEAATVPAITAVNGAVIRGSAGLAAITTLICTNSQFDIRSNVTTITVDGAASAWITREAMTVTTFNFYAGSGIDVGTGTWTTLVVGSESNPGSIDFSQLKTSSAKTITNKVNIHKGSTWNDPDGRVTMSAGFTIPKGRIDDITMDAGIDHTYTIS